jgi:hypothetical protein
VLHTLIDDAGVALTDEFRASCSAIARIADARPDATAIRNDALALYALAREASQGHRLPTWLEAYESMFVQRAETQAVAALERRIADLTAALLDEGDIWIDLFVPAAMARRGVLTEALAQLRTENQ